MRDPPLDEEPVSPFALLREIARRTGHDLRVVTHFENWPAT
jgi:hypothetical protein